MNQNNSKTSSPSWTELFAQRLVELGHRNWIVVADAAYPAQVAPGITTLVTGADHLTVAQFVLAAIENAPHVRAAIYLDAELPYLTGDRLPAIESLRTGLQALLGEQATESLPHEQIIAQLDDAGRKFEILLLKTTLLVPYTSIFFRLECGYWSAAAETELRRRMG